MLSITKKTAKAKHRNGYKTQYQNRRKMQNI